MMLGVSGLVMYHLLINKIILGSLFAFWTVVTDINPTDGPWDFNPTTIWIYRLLYPLVVTFKNSGASLGNITPLVIIFLPALSITKIRKRLAIQRKAFQVYLAAGTVLLLWVVFFFTVVEARYVIFFWIILFIPVAEIIAGLFESESVLLRGTAVSWTVVLMSFILIRSIFISISTYSPLDAQGNPRCFDSVLCKEFAAIK